MKVARCWLGKDVELNVEQDENKRMKPIKPSEYFSAKHWELVEQGIACNIPPPEQLSATDKSMFDLLERASSDLDALQARHLVRDDDDKIRFPFSSSRKRMSTICQNATG